MNQPAHSFTSDAHAEARRKFEARKLTQDCYVWPVRRAEMRHGPTIRARMVEDLAAEKFADRDIPNPRETMIAGLEKKGWSGPQVAAHSDMAMIQYLNEVLRTKT
jgi:hypothetical protein